MTITNQAEKVAAAGNHESQDSQAILEAYRAEFGAETLGSSFPQTSQLQPKSTSTLEQMKPPVKILEPSSFPLPPDADASAPTENATEETRLDGPTTEVCDPPHWASDKDGTDGFEKKQREAADVDIEGTPAAPTHEIIRQESHEISQPCEPSDAVILESSTRHEVSWRRDQVQEDAPSSRSKITQQQPIAAVAAVQKMEFSQQTPTQVNDDRDYSEYADLVPSSPIDPTSQTGSHEPRTLQGDDTGAVNFGILSELGRPSSQVSEDGGFENTRGDWRVRDGTSQQHSSNAYTPYRPQGAAFETPAIPKNPFAAKAPAAPLAGSQLFGQTQFSSAIKKISPTSSRPSPNLFHHSISTNIMETSPLKARANVSSPTDIRTSSPQRLHEPASTSSSQDKDGELEPVEAETPLNSRSTGGEMIPESPPSSDPTPRGPVPRSSGNNGPLAHYEPMKKSQERKYSGEALMPSMEDESDSDDAIRRMERRKRIERKRAKAAEEMERVSFTPKVTRESSDVPARKRRKIMASTVADAAGRIASDPMTGDERPPLVGDSQNGIIPSNETLPDTLPAQSTKATSGDETTQEEQLDQNADMVMEEVNEGVLVEEDMIPATSPAPSIPPTAPPDLPPQIEPELPTLVMEDEDTLSSVPKDSERSSSLPLPLGRRTRTYGRGARRKRGNPFISSSDAPGADEDVQRKMVSSPLRGPALTGAGQEGDGEKATEEVDESRMKQDGPPPATLSPPPSSRPDLLELPPAMSTRSHRSRTNPITPLAARSTGPVPPTSSSLSLLSQTPVPSAKTTPGTQNSPVSEKPESVALPSPKGLRKRPPRGSTKSESPQPTARVTRMARRAPRLDSESTDELNYSPSASALEKSIVQTKFNRSFRQSFGPTYRTCRLFEGMVFAISFQNQVKQHERSKLETKITQAGGTILSQGFQELFEPSPIVNTTSPIFDEEDGLKLTRAGIDSGFTALIADSHSRKAKHMQALALGLPCLAHQWITACLNKGGIVDWEPYVLCAGASAVLGNAIRSRNLIPYAAADARFTDVIDTRLRLLDGQRVLIVVDSKKGRSEAKQPYIFLAALLGPSITRVFTVQQAREALLEHQKAGTPFDWLYIDKLAGKAEAVLAPPEPVGKKRRKSTQQPPPVGNIRVLDDELVIQSLILGRMVEEDEVNF